MGKATGVFLILAGVGTAALVLPAVDKDAERQLAEVMRIATGVSSGVPDVAAVPVQAIAKPQGGQPATGARSSVASAVLATTAKPRGPADTQAAMVAPAVLMPPPMVTKNTVAAPVKPDGGQARANLTRDIQNELKRVGCYDGEISGEWSSSTRRAMKAFIDKVNAALPSDEPDHILRTMVQGHPGNACGRGPAIVHAAAQNPARLAVTPKVVVRSADRPGEVAREVAHVRPAVPKPSWETTIAAVPSSSPPSVSVAAATTTPSPGGGDGRMTSEGRMSVGAPIAGVRDEPAGTDARKSILVPGAIAALGQAGGERPVKSDASANGEFANNSDTADREKADREKAASARAAARRAADARAVRGEDADRRDRQRMAARRQLPEAFKFPSYLGVGAPKYFVKQSFSTRLFERLQRPGESR